MIPRRISLDTLRIFEAAARLGSFTAAADAIGLTQGAVSQRIKALEAELNVTLFRRLTRAVALTPEGQRLLAAVQSGLRRIEEGIDAISTAAGTAPVRLAVSSSVASRWLMARLKMLPPPLSVSVVADDRLHEIGVEADIALRFGPGRYPGLTSKQVGTDQLFPVCSPALRSTPLAELPRLIDTTAESDRSGCGWRDWSAFTGIALGETKDGGHYSHAYLAIQAAEQGMGVALARHLLCADAIKAGKLVRLASDVPALTARYRYSCVTAGEPGPVLVKLIAWLKRQMADQPERLRTAPCGVSVPAMARRLKS
jgi:DNA-binding transcriptional LysR family regulator